MLKYFGPMATAETTIYYTNNDQTLKASKYSCTSEYCYAKEYCYAANNASKYYYANVPDQL